MPGSVERLDEHCLLLHGPFREVELPVDFYLREPDQVDLDEPAALAAFVEQWGRASHLWNGDVGGDAAMDMALARGHARGWLPGDFQFGSNAAVRALRQHAKRLGIDDPHDRPASRSRLVHVVEVRERLGRLRLLAAHLRAWQREEDVDVVWTDWDAPAWTVFGEVLNFALSAFQVRVEVPEARTSTALPPPTAYSVAALQLLNDMALDTPFRECANERCPHGQLFTRQRGRAQYGQHRTLGTRYCSRECAKAQASRERRRRDREDRR